MDYVLNHSGTVTITADGFNLRRFRYTDAEAIFTNFASDPEVTLYLNWPTHKTLEQTRSKIKEWLIAYDKRDTYNWAIALTDTDEVIGTICVASYDKNSSPVLDFGLSSAYRGKGIITESLKSVIDHLFRVVGFSSVQTYYHINNSALATILQAVEFHFNGEEFTERGLHYKFIKYNYISKIEQVPLFFRPLFVETIWGGDKINKILGLTTPKGTGEYWAVCAFGGTSSVIVNGSHSGEPLSKVYEEHREMFGKIKSPNFPLLVKIIDAAESLSVQVHPSDMYALLNEDSLAGKTEAWYILDCEEDAKIQLGHTAKNRHEMKRMIDNGEWDKLLTYVPIKPGDFLSVESGRVHSIPKGTLVLEIQQASNLTYRLYDYDRVDANGNKRELHLEKALGATMFPDKPDKFKQRTTVDKTATITTLCVNEKFTIRKYKISGQYELPNIYPFMIIAVTKGDGNVNGYYIRTGSIFLVPSDLNDVLFEGDFEFIETHI